MTIPQCVCANKISSVFPSAYQQLTNIVISAGVKGIGDFAFEGCSKLKNVMVGNGVKSIGCHAFSGCSGLKSVAIPDSVRSIGEGAFTVAAVLRG